MYCSHWLVDTVWRDMVMLKRVGDLTLKVGVELRQVQLLNTYWSAEGCPIKENDKVVVFHENPDDSKNLDIFKAIIYR